MAMSISQPYRSRQRSGGAEAAGGYQNQPSRSAPPASPQAPRPANDNFPRPANDNYRPFTRTPIPRVSFGTRRTVGRAVVSTVRGTPWGRYLDLSLTALAAIDAAYEWQKKKTILETFNYWCLKKQCGPTIYNFKLDRWIGGPGGCGPGGTICFTQGAAGYYYLPVGPRPQFLPGGGWPPGFVIGGWNTVAGGVSPWAWYGSTPINGKVKAPFIGNVPQMVGQPVTPVVADPWFLPIGQPVAPPTRGPSPGYPDPRPRPTPEVSTGSYGTPSGDPDVSPKPKPQDRPRPPRDGEKERKGRVQKTIARMVQIAFEATEFVDMVDNIYSALPKKLRNRIEKLDKGNMTPQDKMAAIYKYSDQIDLNQMVWNVIANHYSDEVIGRLSAAADTELRSRGVSGFGSIGI